jgi:predicted nucleic acid-binding protein
MGSIICNTGPMIALAGIHKLDILKKLFQSIAVPEPVHREILSGGKHFTGLADYRKADWIQVVELKTAVDPLLVTMLDSGEASVIHVARELGVTMILMDERKGRRIARDIYGLEVNGTARLLTDAKKMNLISSVKEAFQEIRETGYWVHEKIVQAALKEAGEE